MHGATKALAGHPANAQETSVSDGSVIVNRIVHVAAPDELRPVAALAREWGLEPGALRRAATRAGVIVKIGRQAVARRSDLLRLVELLPKPAAKPVPLDPAEAYAAHVKGARR
jgi:hypothetical protein